MLSDRAKMAVAAVLVVLIGVFYILTIRPGHYWGDDFALYILHARNIVEGVPYAQTGYIYNPSNPALSPKTYPPVYPMMLAPVIRWCGMNLEVMKVETILAFLAALFVIFLLFRKDLRFRHTVALVAMLGLNPFFWDFKDRICSDFPFLLFLFLSFLGMRMAGEAEKSGRAQLHGTLLAGLACCLACGSRTLGYLLIPSLVAADVVTRRRVSRLSVSVTLMCGAWVILQGALEGRDSSYFDQFAGWSPSVILHNLIYAASVAHFWANGYSRVAAVLLCLVFCGLAVPGYLSRVRERVTVLEVFLPLYVGVILVWPSEQGFRFFIPVIPLLLFYSFRGLEKIREAPARKLFGVLMAAVLVSYAGEYSTQDFRSPGDGIHTENARAFFGFVSEQTRGEDVFVFAKPRALILCTGRRAAAGHRPKDDMDLWNYFGRIGATHVALGPVDDPPLRLLVERDGARFDPVYSNAEFRLYRIRDTSTP